jgi:hypothetical protein
MVDVMARPERGSRLAIGAAALAAALCGSAAVCLAQANPTTGANPSTGEVVEPAPSQIESPTRALDETGTTSGIEEAGPGMDVPGTISLYDAPRSMFATTSSRVRSGPGTDHGEVGTIPFAGEVAVLGEVPGGDWVYLEMGDGTRGFTAARLLSGVRPTASSTTTTTTTISSDPSVPVCVAGQVLIDMGDGTAICAMLQ